MSVTDQILDTIYAPPFDIVPRQALDFAAYLCGIEEGRVTAWHHLPAGDQQHVLARLHNCTDAASLKDEWLTARHESRISKTNQELEQEAAAWLF